MSRKAALTLVLYWLPPAAYMCIIVALSSTPAASKVPLLWKHQDKVLHFCEYFLLAFLAARAFGGPSATPESWRIALAGAISAAFGAFDELYQQFIPGREASVLDVLADAYGVVAGLLAWSFLVHVRATRDRRAHDEINGTPESGGV